MKHMHLFQKNKYLKDYFLKKQNSHINLFKKLTKTTDFLSEKY